jgi:hypothetical protein
MPAMSMDQGQDVLFDPVPCADEPGAAAGLSRVDRIARDGLERLDQQRLRVV